MKLAKVPMSSKGRKIIFSEKKKLLYGKNRNFKESRMMEMSYLSPERIAIPVNIFFQSRTTVVLLSLPSFLEL